jgi:hypothetical protein
MNMQHYKIVQCGTIGGLMEKVSNMVADGWIPSGGYTRSKDGWSHMQAVWLPPIPEHVRITMEKLMEPDK